MWFASTLYSIRYKQEFGFTIPDRSIIVDDVRVRGKGRAGCQNLTPLPEAQTLPLPLEVSVICALLTLGTHAQRGLL